DVVEVMDSMKLEISIRAAAAGIASNISVSNGDMVDRGQVIAEILPSEE
ncbi:MAG: biotin/lipoyl-containing protein, partial [Silicimonas sp.]